MDEFYEDDKNLRKMMKEMSEVPFRSELQSRILGEAKQDVKSRRLRVGSRRKRFFRNYPAIAAGLVAVVAVGLFGLHLSRRESANQVSHTAATSHHVEFQQSAKHFGLNRAPVQLTDVRIGTVDGDPTNSDVLANVTNVSNHVVSESDIFGVLSFAPQGQPAKDENWITFVNGPARTIDPGQTVVWHFHPTGEQLYGPREVNIREQPHLSFYSAKLVSPKRSDVVWNTSPVKVSNVQSEPRDIGNGVQSVQINARIKNTSSRPLDLSQSRAIIWFASNPTQSFLSDNSIRFMYHLTPEYTGQSWPQVIQPGQSINVNFRVVSNMKSDFFSRTPHVIVIDSASLFR